MPSEPILREGWKTCSTLTVLVDGQQLPGHLLNQLETDQPCQMRVDGVPKGFQDPAGAWLNILSCNMPFQALQTQHVRFKYCYQWQ